MRLQQLHAMIARDATAWWNGKCPNDFSPAEHLMNATINCQTDRERALAESVAAYLMHVKRMKQQRRRSESHD